MGDARRCPSPNPQAPEPTWGRSGAPALLSYWGGPVLGLQRGHRTDRLTAPWSYHMDVAGRQKRKAKGIRAAETQEPLSSQAPWPDAIRKNWVQDGALYLSSCAPVHPAGGHPAALRQLSAREPRGKRPAQVRLRPRLPDCADRPGAGDGGVGGFPGVGEVGEW